ncbi:MAG: transcriptional regulator [Flavobacterium sp. BFFFF1]|uniref:helix-turn-helix domain-containing protein n=1 Tax=Flavobacterium sp. BFFFF1 TaxID=2015557 RepID=UPI000BC3E1F0|nr:helix-turn-helix transcriptional regulator [Flavobacterium sp. BFFFF1]OYU81762.1 MAG: transcriptional regulator [Flavobacterium sp. BFFFF1]
MLTTADFIKRLEQLMEHYELNASLFADKIGVQRSGISHLLSGRNKPSLDFVMKISEEFPEVNLYWLLKGEGTFLNTAGTEFEVSHNTTTEPKHTKSPTLPISRNTAIEKIVIFYQDGSFSDYQPLAEKP